MLKTNFNKTLIVAGLLGLVFVFSYHFASGASTASTAATQEINELDKTIKDRKTQLDQIKKKQEAYKKELQKKQSERASLVNQLAIVDNRAAEAQLNLDQVKIDIETTGLEIQKAALEIQAQDEKITANKSHLGSALKLLSQEDDKSQLEILLLNDYLTEYLNQLTYLQNINGKISDSLTELRGDKESMEENRLKLEANKERLRQLRADLEEKQVALAEEKDTKNFLLDQTKSSEAEYQTLLNQARREQESASNDIVTLERSLREKLKEQNNGKMPLVYEGFMWPVPKNTITAFFHDPSYPFRNVFEHPAVDIRAAQGTPIRAAESGYVGRAKDGGYNYSYISLLHGNELSTVYGHVSRIMIKEGDYVNKGDIIGLSGAMPGTPGAGPLTTGPHLHFEVRLKGIPVNPQSYLP